MTNETQTKDQTTGETAGETTGQTTGADAAERAPREGAQPPGPAARIAARMIEIDKADLKGLRRMDGHWPESQAAWRLMAENGLTGDSGAERTWAFIIHCIALMTPAVHGRAAHSSRQPVGRTLFLGNESRREAPLYGEPRLGQLLEARGGNFEDKMVHLARMLGHSGIRLDWDEMAQLIINERTDPRAVEASAARILRDYYRAAPRGRAASR